MKKLGDIFMTEKKMNNWVVRVINLKARREHLSFLEVTDNMWVMAESKQAARKVLIKQLAKENLLYGKDYVLGTVGKYTGKGKTIGFESDKLQCSLPHHTFVRYVWDKKQYKYNKTEENQLKKYLPKVYHNV